MIAEPLHIADLAALHDWRARVRAVLMPRVLPAVEFDFASLPPAENRRLAAEAARLQRACGCTTSGLFMTLAVLWTALSLLASSTPLAAVTPGEWLRHVLLIVAAAACGKGLGLVRARWQLVRLADAIADRVARVPTRPHRVSLEP